jgi:hypothetical protein
MGKIGQVWVINGAGDGEFAAVHLDKEQLIALASYWTEVAIGIEYFVFLYCCYGSSDLRRKSFGWARVGRIRDLLGEEVDAAVDEVYRTFGEKQDKQAWETFIHGSKEEREALQDKIQLQMTGSAEKAK